MFRRKEDASPSCGIVAAFWWFLEQIQLGIMQMLPDMAKHEIPWLINSNRHISLLTTRRVDLIISRVRLVAGMFMVLTPLWIVLDIAVFPREIWYNLVLSRLCATGAFALLVLAVRRMTTMRDAYIAMSCLLMIPTLFFIQTSLHLSHFVNQGLTGTAETFVTGYTYLPFVMMAGLSLFPLTLAELLTFSSPMLGAQVLAAYLQIPVLNWPNFMGSFWLIMLITAVAVLSGMSQLSMMIVLVRETVRDGLTSCFSRSSGEELLRQQFELAVKNHTPLAVAFIDLDHFKSINDTYGHEAGDLVLKQAAHRIDGDLRTGDVLARWGGEEFVLILPNTSLNNAVTALNRLRDRGLGARPDGSPVTASIGIAELSRQKAEDWAGLVEAADAKMYEAKTSGRNRICY